MNVNTSFDNIGFQKYKTKTTQKPQETNSNSRKVTRTYVFNSIFNIPNSASNNKKPEIIPFILAVFCSIVALHLSVCFTEVKSVATKSSDGRSKPNAASTAKSGTPTSIRAYMTSSVSGSTRSAADHRFAAAST